jgi:hypothetical protein
MEGALIADLREQIAKGQLMVIVGAGVLWARRTTSKPRLDRFVRADRLHLFGPGPARGTSRNP